MSFLRFTSTQKKKEILGTDIKTHLNNDDFKININKPRIFANTVSIKMKILLQKYFYNV